MLYSDYKAPFIQRSMGPDPFIHPAHAQQKWNWKVYKQDIYFHKIHLNAHLKCVCNNTAITPFSNYRMSYNFSHDLYLFGITFSPFTLLGSMKILTDLVTLLIFLWFWVEQNHLYKRLLENICDNVTFDLLFTCCSHYFLCV